MWRRFPACLHSPVASFSHIPACGDACRKQQKQHGSTPAATSFAEPESRLPANVSVISREDIGNSPARDLPGILKSNAGVVVRALSGSPGIDSTIDIRGFGEAPAATR
ncbi:TonB-dependent receptor plug domain-containing protein [Accumulibacter sp.]|uniref:TonB-dependent receptor n=1 Tax=Accumulibacter sp. TaxID=2053492 RepID=UPI0025ECDD94|nr:TonB-dependent receptor plug domain-containing protein [Accumulibacter sp.]MCM8613198.1 TonB-dependent receptor plug domain-containing protein [Accumulibacter sp.]MCM8636515.1 TonB-dependent receptor plug domain-containing protein [Accumulibacter sp.]MCM8640251.1 TonB-dependent receptor plug domain-containing protein [Accumulibacter sp.]